MKFQGTKIISLAKSPEFGDVESAFDDSDHICDTSCLKSIEIRSGEIIDCITAHYVDGTSFTHGGKGGASTTLIFDSDEYILKIEGCYGMWDNMQVIKQMTVTTSKNRIKTFGTNKYGYTSRYFSITTTIGAPVIGFYGSVTSGQGNYVSAIGTINISYHLPDFYSKARSNLISSLYDQTFYEKKELIGWSGNDDIMNDKFRELKNEITDQKEYFVNPYESQYFNAVRNNIRTTNLFSFLKDLPKGAILHLHPSSMGDYSGLLDRAAACTTDTCQVRFLYNSDKKTINPINTDPDSFHWKSASPVPKATDPNLGPYMDLSAAYKDPTLKQAALDLLVLNPKVMDYPGDMWDLFQPVFSRGGVLFSNTDIKRTYYRNAFTYLVADEKLSHVEIRSSWNADNESKPDTTENIIINAAEQEGISLKVINFNSRHFDEEEPIDTDILKKIIATGTAIRDKKSPYLCGYDLVGEEDTGATTQFLTKDFYLAYETLGNYLPPFFFHDGESDLAPDYDPEDEQNIKDPDTAYFNNNLVDAYLLNTMNFDGFQMTTNRVGHGLELFKTPKLMDDYKNANLAIELCPISNQLLRYVKDLREHPGQSYLAMGLPVSLSPDDPAIYGYQGVAFDFWEAVIAWGLDLKMVKVLCYYSLANSALDAATKATTIQNWKQQWDAYISSCIKSRI